MGNPGRLDQDCSNPLHGFVDNIAFSGREEGSTRDWKIFRPFIINAKPIHGATRRFVCLQVKFPVGSNTRDNLQTFLSS